MEAQRETMSMRPLKTPVFIDPTMDSTLEGYQAAKSYSFPLTDVKIMVKY